MMMMMHTRMQYVHFNWCPEEHSRYSVCSNWLLFGVVVSIIEKMNAFWTYHYVIVKFVLRSGDSFPFVVVVVAVDKDDVCVTCLNAIKRLNFSGFNFTATNAFFPFHLNKKTPSIQIANPIIGGKNSFCWLMIQFWNVSTSNVLQFDVGRSFFEYNFYLLLLGWCGGFECTIKKKGEQSHCLNWMDKWRR